MSKSQTRASNKYNAKAYDRIALQVYKGQKEQIQAYAQEKGESLNGYINRLIAQDMGERLTKPTKYKKAEAGAGAELPCFCISRNSSTI